MSVPRSVKTGTMTGAFFSPGGTSVDVICHME